MRTVFREGEEKPQASRGGQAVRKGDGARLTQADLLSVCWKHRQKKQNAEERLFWESSERAAGSTFSLDKNVQRVSEFRSGCTSTLMFA